MLCDCPSNYLKEPKIMEFLAVVPTVWDETKVLDGKVGEYVAVARRSGDFWFIGAMTDWTPRDLQIDFGFLDSRRYIMEIYADGVNADRYASDFRKLKESVTDADSMTIHLAPGGGWAAWLRVLEEK
jgi:alpha-glucosidase